MAKSFIYVKGKASWARLVKPNDWNSWSIVIHPDPEGLELVRDLQASGLKNTLKKDPDGYYVQFRRPVTKQAKNGKVLSFNPPTVTDKEGRPMDGTTVGNGSDVTLQLEVYEHGTPGGGTAKAARLESVRVDNLVLFNPKEDFPEEIQGQMDELREQPKPAWA